MLQAHPPGRRFSVEKKTGTKSMTREKPTEIESADMGATRSRTSPEPREKQASEKEKFCHRQ